MILPAHRLAQHGFELFRSRTARIVQINLVMLSGERIALLLDEAVHRLNDRTFVVIRADVQNLHGFPFSKWLEANAIQRHRILFVPKSKKSEPV